jgi:16S rRNA (guanine(966)-N(2))-methyltransferase RsmD
MRIISGKYRSRRILMPSGIRPTKDKVREAVFNVLAGRIRDSLVLDMFAGSGAFGIEALSRGAASALFVDKSDECIKTIEKNLDILQIPIGQDAEVVKKDSFQAIKALHKEARKFDIIFLDPPYYRNMATKCLNNISIYDILAPSGFVIAEHFRKDVVPEEAQSLMMTRRLDYSDVAISIYKKKGEK